MTSSDKDFAAATIQAIGRCASNIAEITDACLNGLVSLMSNRDGMLEPNDHFHDVEFPSFTCLLTLCHSKFYLVNSNSLCQKLLRTDDLLRLGTRFHFSSSKIYDTVSLFQKRLSLRAWWSSRNSYKCRCDCSIRDWFSEFEKLNIHKILKTGNRIEDKKGFGELVEMRGETCDLKSKNIEQKSIG